MERQDAKRSLRERCRRRWIKRVVLAICGLLVVVFGFVIYMLIFFEGPIYEEERARHYALWNAKNRQPFADFKELATDRHWTMYALARSQQGGHSIGLFDFGRFTYKPLYTPLTGRRIAHSSKNHRGRIAFVEYTRKGGGDHCERCEFELGILERTGAVTKVRLDDEEFEWWYPRNSLIALWSHQVFFASDKRAYLYNIEAKTLDSVYELQQGESLGMHGVALLAEGKSLALLVEKRLGSELVILDAGDPHLVVSRLEGVACGLVVGDRIIIQRNRSCFLVLSGTGETDRLASGELVIALGDDVFVLYDAGTFYKYDIAGRSAELLFTAPVGLRYDHRDVMVSPDGLFLFAPQDFYWPLPKARPTDPVYHVYEIKAGQERGAFLNPCQGKYEFEFLGWAGPD